MTTPEARPVTAERPRHFSLWAALLIAIGLHLASHNLLPPPQPANSLIAPPPDRRILLAASVGEREFTAQLTGLYVQGFDARPGVRGTLRNLDYPNLERWLSTLNGLDRESDYALQLALLYSSVADAQKKRRMLEFIEEAFLQNPDRRWRALAEASVIARHELNDLPLALRFAGLLERKAVGPEVPGWAQQMHVLLLADIGQRERAKIILGALIASGKVHNTHELRLLQQRLLAQ